MEKNSQGKQYGYLTAMHISEPDSFGGAVWWCRCSCGRELDVSEAMLISGIKRSCGCKRNRSVNLKGQKFGRLTVLEPVPERAQDGSVYWLCRCECGRYITQSANKLRMGRSVSCGCMMNMAARAAMTYIDGTCVDIMLSDTISKNNTSGIRGVAKKRNKWQAYINYSGRRISLGNYDTKELAAEARREAEKKVRARLESLMNETKENAEEETQWQTETFLRN